jgi:hypothetical protein
VDSQSVKTTGVGGEERGYDGGKKIKGRKRHFLVDTEGFVLTAKVHSAKVMDWDGIKTLLQRADIHFPRLKHLWVDTGYRGEDKGKDWVEKKPGWGVELVERPRGLAAVGDKTPPYPVIQSAPDTSSTAPSSSLADRRKGEGAGVWTPASSNRVKPA